MIFSLQLIKFASFYFFTYGTICFLYFNLTILLDSFFLMVLVL